MLGESAILRVTLGTDGRVLAARWISVRLVNGLPRPDLADASARLVGRLSGQDFPSGHFRISAGGVFHLPAAHRRG